MTYEEWLDREWGVPAWGTSQQRQRVMRQAAIKRARKAAKRRRDAELTRLGRIAAVEQTIADTRWYMAVRLDDWLHGLHDESAASARATMRAIRRGEVQP